MIAPPSPPLPKWGESDTSRLSLSLSLHCVYYARAVAHDRFFVSFVLCTEPSLIILILNNETFVVYNFNCNERVHESRLNRVLINSTDLDT